MWPHRQQPTRLPCPWYSPGKSTGVGCHFLLQGMKVKSESEVAQLCPTLSDPMDCSLPGSSVHGIFQARVLKWGAISYSMCICAQSCPTLYSPIDCSSPGSSAYGIFQATILKWGAISYSRGSSQPRDWTHVSCLLHWLVWFFMTSATWGALDLTQELAKSQVLRAILQEKTCLWLEISGKKT